MTAYAEGTPCWADAMFADVEGAKSFYGEVLGWTFGEASSEFGNYTQAYSDGKAVAAVVPPMPGAEGQSAWCLYLASPDAKATAAKITANGGTVLMDPMQVGDFGSMLLAADPGGAVFGVWQGGQHEGFEKREEPGAYCWAEVFTREPAKVDTFYPAVFPYTAQQVNDANVDFRTYSVADRPALGRMAMGQEFPAEVPSFVNVYFAVPDCDAAVATATGLGAELRFGPMTSPFGRFAGLTDPQGANFSVIDPDTTEGEMPPLTDV
ncbi:VOC family protein [Kitasatospora sp. NPDC101801]|uniref:VOC family protein n=1 Tax=Kitasatospora sp. NPDC101801 TaxID=3364103 RepID=UPI003826E512